MPHGNDRNERLRRILIIGAGATGRFLCRTLNRQKPRKFHVVGFVDDNPDLIGIQIQKVHIYGPTSEIGNLINKLGIEQLVIAMPTVPARRVRGIVESIKERNVVISTIPSYLELIEGKQPIDDIRHIGIDDVLPREKIEIDTVKIAGEIAGKTVLITGAAGSIGSDLSRQVLQFRPATVLLLDQAESPLFYLMNELASRADGVHIVPVVADITNGPRMMALFQKYRPNLVCHAAAYKHVPLMEDNFEESVTNNVVGTRTIANIAHMCQADIFVMMSTDKAVNPTSTMGLTKRIAEIYIQSLNRESTTRFMTVRFGNVFDSAGNVIQVFKRQIRQGGPVTVTHPEMLRNFMTISDAVKLVLEAAFFGRGGEIFGLDMGKPVKILDVAKSMIRIAGYEPGKDIEIVFTGMRPGEKLVEEHSYRGEDIIETPHPKIFVRNSRQSDWEVVRGKVEGIVDNIYRFDRKTVIEDYILGLVPEYQYEMPQVEEKRFEMIAGN